MSVWHSLDIVKFIQHSLVALKKFMTLTSALVAFKIHRLVEKLLSISEVRSSIPVIG